LNFHESKKEIWPQRNQIQLHTNHSQITDDACSDGGVVLIIALHRYIIVIKQDKDRGRLTTLDSKKKRENGKDGKELIKKVLGSEFINLFRFQHIKLLLHTISACCDPSNSIDVQNLVRDVIFSPVVTSMFCALPFKQRFEFFEQIYEWFNSSDSLSKRSSFAPVPMFLNKIMSNRPYSACFLLHFTIVHKFRTFESLSSSASVNNFACYDKAVMNTLICEIK